MDEQKKLLLEKIEELMAMRVGDIRRLEHTKSCIVENRRVYKSDYNYIQDLLKQKGIKPIEPSHGELFGYLRFCKKCNGELVAGAKFCSSCGTEQSTYSDFDEVLSRRKQLREQSLRFIQKIRLYQIFAVLGGIAVLIPVGSAVSSIDRLTELGIFYFNYDISRFANLFYALGAVSIIWSLLVMIFPFVIRKPKKVGKFLFFSSFGILFVSLITGVVGFVLIMIGGIIALKRRY